MVEGDRAWGRSRPAGGWPSTTSADGGGGRATGGQCHQCKKDDAQRHSTGQSFVSCAVRRVYHYFLYQRENAASPFACAGHAASTGGQSESETFSNFGGKLPT